MYLIWTEILARRKMNISADFVVYQTNSVFHGFIQFGFHLRFYSETIHL